MTTSNPSQDPPAVIFTPSQRIKQLNEIDKVPASSLPGRPPNRSINRIPRAQDLSHLLHSAGSAIEALTLPPSPSSSAEADNPKEKFRNMAAQYFSLLSSIDVRLRRQIYALEEADILSPSSSSAVEKVEKAELLLPGSQGSISALGSSQGTTGASGGKGGVGMGGLDVGWLNSRNDSVGKEMEAELWSELEGLVQGVEKKKMGEDVGDRVDG